MNPPLTLWQRVVRASSPLALTQTFTYYITFIALGMTTASLGPTLLGLANQTGSEISQISFLFTARALGYLIGSFVGGRFYDHLPGHRTMAGALLAMGILLAAVPTLPLLWILTAVLLAVGIGEGVVDVGANTLIVWVHREKVGPYMNGLHLFFAIGAFLSPLLVAWVVLFTGNFGLSYWLLALILVPLIIRLISLPNPEPIVSRHDAASARVPVWLLALLCLFFLLYAGAEQSFGGWIFTYTVKADLADATLAAYVNAAYWGAFTIGRVLAIPIAARIRPRLIILTDLFLSLLGLGLMLIVSNSSPILWLGTILFGLGIASGFPTMLTFAGRHITITGTVTGWFFVGASLGGMILPWLIGQLFEPIGPTTVLLIIGSATALAALIFALILLNIRRTQKRYNA